MHKYTLDLHGEPISPKLYLMHILMLYTQIDFVFSNYLNFSPSPNYNTNLEISKTRKNSFSLELPSNMRTLIKSVEVQTL